MGNGGGFGDDWGGSGGGSVMREGREGMREEGGGKGKRDGGS